MRWYLLGILLLVFSGCISQELVDLSRAEQVETFDSYDTDGDGVADVFVYRFRVIPIPSAGLQMERTMLAYREVEVGYTGGVALEDIEVVNLYQQFDSFRNGIENQIGACSSNLGLLGVTCVDAVTCNKICAASSSTCKNRVDAYDPVVGESILRYAQRSLALSDAMVATGNTIIVLLDSDSTDRSFLAHEAEGMLNHIYALDANPLFRYDALGLCPPLEADGRALQAALRGLGNVQLQTRSYHYTMFIHLVPLEDDQTFSQSQLELMDRLPGSIADAPALISPLAHSAFQNGSFATISFQSIQKPTNQKNLVMYSFSSPVPPEEVASQLQAPTFRIQILNLEALAISADFFEFFRMLTGNPYVAFGWAVAIPFIVVLFLYSLITLLYYILRALLAKQKAGNGIQKAFTNISVRWKTDAIVGIALLALGFGIALFFAPAILEAVNIFGMSERAFSDPTIFVGFVGVFFGTILVYLALENRVKIALLEDVYGKQIRGARDVYFANVNQLKEKVQQLRTMVKQMGKENIDVSPEYDVIASLTAERLKPLQEKFNEDTQRDVHVYLRKVDDALERLHEKKRVADEHWEQWKLMIAKLLENQEEVNASQLLTIPAALRIWVLAKFVEDDGVTGVVFEGDAIKRKKLSPENMVQSLFTGGLVRALVVVKNNKVILSKTSAGSSSVNAALGLKLLGYIQTTLKNLGYSEYSSFAGIGDVHVLLIRKEQGLDAIMLVPRDKFKEALAAWKERSKYFA